MVVAEPAEPAVPHTCRIAAQPLVVDRASGVRAADIVVARLVRTAARRHWCGAADSRAGAPSRVGLLKHHLGTKQHLERGDPVLVVDRIVRAVHVGLDHTRKVAVNSHLVVHCVGPRRHHYAERRDVVMPARGFAPVVHVPPHTTHGRASVTMLGHRASAAQGRHLWRRWRALWRRQLWQRRRRGRQRALEPRPHGVGIVVAPLVDARCAAHLEPQIVALLEDLGVGHALQRAPAGDAVRIVVDVASEAVARPWSSHAREPAARAHAPALRLGRDLGARRARRVNVGVARVGLHERHWGRRRRRRDNTGNSEVTGKRADFTHREPERVGTRRQVERVRFAAAMVSRAILVPHCTTAMFARAEKE